MNKEFVESNINQIKTLSNSEKKELIYLCNLAIKDLKEKNRKSNKLAVSLNNKDEYKLKITASRNINYNYKTSEEKLKAIGLDESNESVLIEKIKKGEINTNHITNIAKSDIDNSITELSPQNQYVVIEKIIKNTNEKNLINREELATESLKSGNISLNIVENWYRGFIRSGNQFESKLYVNKEIIELLSKEQIQQIIELINSITNKSNLFIKSLN